jgi:hypothetical protein
MVIITNENTVCNGQLSRLQILQYEYRFKTLIGSKLITNKRTSPIGRSLDCFEARCPRAPGPSFRSPREASRKSRNILMEHLASFREHLASFREHFGIVQRTSGISFHKSLEKHALGQDFLPLGIVLLGTFEDARLTYTHYLLRNWQVSLYISTFLLGI